MTESCTTISASEAPRRSVRPAGPMQVGELRGYPGNSSAGVELPHKRLVGAGAATAQHGLLRLRHIAHRLPQADVLRRWGNAVGPDPTVVSSSGLSELTFAPAGTPAPPAAHPRRLGAVADRNFMSRVAWLRAPPSREGVVHLGAGWGISARPGAGDRGDESRLIKDADERRLVHVGQSLTARPTDQVGAAQSVQ